MSTDLEWLRDNKDLIVGELGEDASLIQELEQELQLAAETPSPLLHDGAAPSASKWAGKLEECRMVDPSLPPAPAPAAPAGQSSSGGGHARDAWLRETDPATGYPYWYNTETGDSCWEHEVAEPPPRTTARAPDVPPVSRQPTSVTERRANQERGDDDLSSSDDGDDDDGDDDDDCCCCLGRPKPRSQYKAIELHGS